MEISSATAAKAGSAAVIGVGSGTGIYYGIKARREALDSSESESNTELEKLSGDTDWTDRDWSYFNSYLKVHPNGEHKIPSLSTEKKKDVCQVKEWCEEKWSKGEGDTLVKYWCYKKETWLDAVTKDDKDLGIKSSITANSDGKFEEYEAIKNGLSSWSNDEKFFKKLETENNSGGRDGEERHKSTVVIEWCNAESGLFYEGDTDVYSLFKQHCLTKTPVNSY